MHSWSRQGAFAALSCWRAALDLMDVQAWAARRGRAAPGRRAMSGTSIETGHTLNTTFRQYAIPVIDTTPGAAHHHHEEVELWKKITAVGSVAVSACFLNWMATDHHHMHTPPPYPCAHSPL